MEGWLFHTVSLMSLGLRVQLGHRPGEECNSRRAAYDDDFVVIDIHGIHEIKLDYCGCTHAPSCYKQLLCARWFPATMIDPRMAATFAVLQLFHLLSFKSKVSAYKFYHSLTQWTDNIGTKPIWVSYLSIGNTPHSIMYLLLIYRIVILCSSA